MLRSDAAWFITVHLVVVHAGLLALQFCDSTVNDQSGLALPWT